MEEAIEEEEEGSTRLAWEVEVGAMMRLEATVGMMRLLPGPPTLACATPGRRATAATEPPADTPTMVLWEEEEGEVPISIEVRHQEAATKVAPAEREEAAATMIVTLHPLDELLRGSLTLLLDTDLLFEQLI